MNDDVKILQLSYGNYVSLDDYNELKFVYENDVQEIKALVESMKYREMDFCKLHDEVEDYKSRVEKAIKVIKNKYPVLCESEGDFKEELLDILQNGSDEE